MIDTRFRFVALLIAFVIMLFSMNIVLAYPSGASNITVLNSSYSTPDSAGSTEAQAGNVSELSIYGISTTSSWQGYSGNVSGLIKLADGSGNVLYNWSVASPSGEIYASTNNSIQWTYVQCLNFTARGNYSSDVAQAGGTSLYGTNLTQLQAQFGINDSDPDSVNNTFIGTTHTSFYTGSRQFSPTACKIANVFDSTGKSVNGKFQEVLLYEPTSASVIFTSLLEKDLAGFDQKTHDFEMLVLENGHNGDVSVTPYYFFVELQ